MTTDSTKPPSASRRLSNATADALPFKRLRHDAILPARAHEGDAGFDVVAVEAQEIEPGERRAVSTGIAVAIPFGHAGLLLPRSGLSRKHGITLANSPGLIDAGYRGEVVVTMINPGTDT